MADTALDIAKKMGFFTECTPSFSITGSVLTTSGANAQAVMGDYAGHYVFVDEQNEFQVAPVERTPTAHIAGWEGAGPQPADDPTQDAIEQDLYRAIAIQNERIKGVSVAGAITALHGQRRADGRPVTFIPEIE